MFKSLVPVIVAAYLILCFSNYSYSSSGNPDLDKQIPASSLDIAHMTEQAAVIVVGSRPREVRGVLNITGEVWRPDELTGYRIELVRFIKGANTTRLARPTLAVEPFFGTRKQPLLVPAKHEDEEQFIYFLAEKRASFDSSPRRFPISSDAWFVSASSEALKQVEDALPQAQVWGHASSGLVAGIRTFKQSYVPGEPVQIELHLKNVSDHVLIVPQQRLMFSDCYPFLGFSGGTGITVYPGGGVSFGGSHALSVALEKPVGSSQRDAMPPVELQPGQVYVERIDLSSWQWTSSDGLTPFRPQGTLKMHGFLTIGELHKVFKYTKEEAGAMWNGQLEIPWFALSFLSAR